MFAKLKTCRIYNESINRSVLGNRIFLVHFTKGIMTTLFLDDIGIKIAKQKRCYLGVGGNRWKEFTESLEFVTFVDMWKEKRERNHESHIGC